MSNLIFHVSDIHIGSSPNRYAEYNYVFDLLIKDVKCQEELGNNCVVVITGDVFHKKVNLTPGCILCFQRLIWGLGTTKILIIPGNHDINLNDENAKDLLSPLIHDMPNVTLSTSTEIIQIADMNFVHASILDTYNGPKVKNFYNNGAPFSPNNNLVQLMSQVDKPILLYHGMAKGTKLITAPEIEDAPKSYEMEAHAEYMDIETIKKAYMCLLGDIHQTQNISQYAAYAGSLIQQNQGEHYIKGYLLWDYDTREQKFIPIVNKFCKIRIDCRKGITMEGLQKQKQEQLEFFKDTDYKYSGISIMKNTGQNTVEEEKLIESVFGKIDKISSILLQNNRILDAPSSAKTIIDIVKEKINNIPDAELLVCDLASVATDSSPADKISNIKLKITNAILKLHDSCHADKVVTKWHVKHLQWSNFMNYGPDNYINFEDHAGITGIIAKNKMGKTAVIDVLVYALFGSHCRGTQGSIVRYGEKFVHTKVIFEVNGINYCMERRSNSKNDNYMLSIETLEPSAPAWKNITPESLQKTYEFISTLIGTIDDFMVTGLCYFGLGMNTDIIRASNAERRLRMSSLFGMDKLKKIKADITAAIKKEELKLKKYDLPFALPSTLSNIITLPATLKTPVDYLNYALALVDFIIKQKQATQVQATDLKEQQFAKQEHCLIFTSAINHKKQLDLVSANIDSADLLLQSLSAKLLKLADYPFERTPYAEPCDLNEVISITGLPNLEVQLETLSNLSSQLVTIREQLAQKQNSLSFAATIRKYEPKYPKSEAANNLAAVKINILDFNWELSPTDQVIELQKQYNLLLNNNILEVQFSLTDAAKLQDIKDKLCDMTADYNIYIKFKEETAKNAIIFKYNLTALKQQLNKATAQVKEIENNAFHTQDVVKEVHDECARLNDEKLTLLSCNLTYVKHIEERRDQIRIRNREITENLHATFSEINFAADSSPDHIRHVISDLLSKLRIKCDVLFEEVKALQEKYPDFQTVLSNVMLDTTDQILLLTAQLEKQAIDLKQKKTTLQDTSSHKTRIQILNENIAVYIKSSNMKYNPDCLCCKDNIQATNSELAQCQLTKDQLLAELVLICDSNSLIESELEQLITEYQKTSAELSSKITTRDLTNLKLKTDELEKSRNQINTCEDALSLIDSQSKVLAEHNQTILDHEALIKVNNDLIIELDESIKKQEECLANYNNLTSNVQTYTAAVLETEQQIITADKILKYIETYDLMLDAASKLENTKLQAEEYKRNESSILRKLQLGTAITSLTDLKYYDDIAKQENLQNELKVLQLEESSMAQQIVACINQRDTLLKHKRQTNYRNYLKTAEEQKLTEELAKANQAIESLHSVYNNTVDLLANLSGTVDINLVEISEPSISQILESYKAHIAEAQLEQIKLYKLSGQLDEKHKQAEEYIVVLNTYIANVPAIKEQQLIYSTYLACIGKNGLQTEIIKNNIGELNTKINDILRVVTDFTISFVVEPESIKINVIYDRRSIEDKTEPEQDKPEQDKTEQITVPLATASGYQTFIVSLVCRLVLTTMLPYSPSFIIIDEGFGCMDKENLAKFTEYIKEINRIYKFIFLISHSEELQNSLETPIKIVKKTDSLGAYSSVQAGTINTKFADLQLTGKVNTTKAKKQVPSETSLDDQPIAPRSKEKTKVSSSELDEPVVLSANHIKCECGKIILKKSLASHILTARHKNLIDNTKKAN